MNLKNGTNGRLELMVGPKQSSGKIIEDVTLEVIIKKTIAKLILCYFVIQRLNLLVFK